MGQPRTRTQTRSPAPRRGVPPAMPESVAVAAFVLVTLFFFWRHLTGSRFLWEDFVEQFYPNQVFAARHWAAGVLPFWNPYTFCGMPFLADPQVGFFYLPHSLLGLVQMVLDRLPFEVVQALVFLHFPVAQWGMFRLSRAFGASPLGALLAGIGYGLCGVLTHHVIHPMIVYHLAWLPWVLLLLKRAIEQARWSAALGAGLVLGMSLHAGHPQTVLYEYLLLLGFGIWLVGLRIRQRGWGLARVFDAARAVLPLVLAAGLFAVQLLPTQELASLSERASGQGLEWAAEISLRPEQLLTLVVPKLFGSTEPGREHVPFFLPHAPYYHYWETATYVGIPVLLLALVGLLRRWKTPLGLFWLVAAAFAVLFALGKHGFLFPLLYQLPGFSLFRVPPRILFVLVLALGLFAAWGFDEFWQHPRNRSLLALLLWVSLPIALIALGVSSGFLLEVFEAPQRFVPKLQSEGTLALVWTFATVLLVLALSRGWLPAPAAGIALAVVLAADLAHAHRSFTQSPTPPESLYRLPPELKQRLQPKPPEELFRVSMRTEFGMAMLRNQGLLDSIMLYEGYNQLRLQRRNPPLPTAAQTFDLLNIRYQLDTAAQQLLFRERPTAFPRGWMVYRARVVPSDSTEAVLRRGEIDPRQEALLEQHPGIRLPDVSPESVPHSIRCRIYEHNRQQWEVYTAEPGLLCLSEIWYPAWKATVDGSPAPLLRAYHSLRAVPIPAGTHVVELRYDSASFRTGAWISALTAAATLGAFLVSLRYERRRQ